MKLTFVALLVFCSSFAARFGYATEGDHHIAANNASFQDLSEAAAQARQQNHDADAIKLYQRALAIKPDWQEGLWYLGTLLYQNEQYAGARDSLRRFVAEAPSAGPGLALLGMSEFQTREYDRALSHMQQGLALGLGGRKDMANSVSYFIAVLLTRFERYDDSLNLMFRMIASGHDQLPLTEAIGLAALRMPLLPAEIPQDRRELVRLAGEGAFTSQTPQYKEADEIFKKMTATYPDEPGVHFLYGVYLLDIRPEEGAGELRRELQISPTHVPARLRLAAYCLQNQLQDEALTLATEAVKLDPTYPAGHMMLGEVEVAKGSVPEGIKELELAQAAQPSLPRVHWDLLRAYTAAGRKDDAKREKDIIETISRSGSDSPNGAPGGSGSSDQ